MCYGTNRFLGKTNRLATVVDARKLVERFSFVTVIDLWERNEKKKKKKRYNYYQLSAVQTHARLAAYGGYYKQHIGARTSCRPADSERENRSKRPLTDLNRFLNISSSGIMYI